MKSIEINQKVFEQSIKRQIENYEKMIEESKPEMKQSLLNTLKGFSDCLDYYNGTIGKSFGHVNKPKEFGH